MGFSDPILGGGGELIRDRMHSENYVPDVSGWDIEKSGSVEFQDALIRGDLSGSTFTVPAGAGPGQARLVIDSVNGITVYDAANNQLALIGFGASYMLTQLIQGIPTNGSGRANVTLKDIIQLAAGFNAATKVEGDIIVQCDNNYTDGVIIYLRANDANGNNNPTANVRLYDGNFNGSMFRISDDFHAGKTMYDRLITFGHPVSSGSTTGDIIYVKLNKDAALNLTTDGYDRYRFGKGVIGAYYSEQRTINAIAVANSVQSVLTNANTSADLLHSDSGTAWGAGGWTAPEDGYYTFSLSCAFTTITAGARFLMALHRGSSAASNQFARVDRIVTGTTDLMTTLTATKYMSAGDLVIARVFQTSGGALTVDSGENSYITIARHL